MFVETTEPGHHIHGVPSTAQGFMFGLRSNIAGPLFLTLSNRGTFATFAKCNTKKI